MTLCMITGSTRQIERPALRGCGECDGHSCGLVSSFIPQTWCQTSAHRSGPRWSRVCSNRLGRGNNAGSGAPTLGLQRGYRGSQQPGRERKTPSAERPAGKLFARPRPRAMAAKRRTARPPRPRPEDQAGTWWFSFLPPAGAAGPPGPLVMFTYRERVSGLLSVHILRASHTDARLRHSQPANSLIRDSDR